VASHSGKPRRLAGLFDRSRVAVENRRPRLDQYQQSEQDERLQRGSA
jgi:hypothetical protein